MVGGNCNIGCPHFRKILIKRLTHILTIFFSLIVITSCEDANVTKLKKEINTANLSCPISMGISGDLISIKYYEKNNSVLLYYSLNEDIAGAVFLKKNKDNMMKQFRLLLSNKESMQLVKDMVNAKASLMIIYKTPSTGKTVKFSVPYEELKEIKESPLTDLEIKKMMIENKVAIENAACPGKESDGMIQTKVAIVDDMLVYYIQLNEDVYDIKSMQMMQDELKGEIHQSLKNMRNDPTIQKELQLLYSLDMGYMYRYYGKDSKKYVDVVLAADELSQYIKNE